MNRRLASLPPGYFDERYAADPDPWDFATSAYERAKYDATLDALPRERYGAALEIGCSIGVLSRDLARRCDALLSLDLTERALDQARARCADQFHVRFARLCVPGEWPEGRFDLIVLSEVVYYLDAGDVARLVERVRGSLTGDGDVILVHFTGETHYPLTGDEAAERFMASASPRLRPTFQHREAEYRLDVLRSGESGPTP